MKRLITILVLCLTGAAAGALLYGRGDLSFLRDRLVSESAPVPAAAPDTLPFAGTNAPGRYLSARYAQRHHDWAAAGRFIAPVLEANPENLILLKRAMVLAMGAGEVEKAVDLARRVEALGEEENALSELFIAIGDFGAGDYEQAAARIRALPSGGLSDFIMPLLRGWSAAALGKDETAQLGRNTVHLYHAILISDFLGRTGNIESLLRQAIRSSDLTAEDIERIADIYVHIGDLKQAVSLYGEALSIDPSNEILAAKIAGIERGDLPKTFVRIETPEQGVAEALYDMARLLAQDYSDESARVFAQMALHLNPAHTRCRFLLASLAARNDRIDEAVAAYQGVPADDEHYAQVRRIMAELLYDQGRTEEALAGLEELVRTRDDIDALIQIGDIYRMQERFGKAIEIYGRAEEKLGGTVPAEFWRLYYVRGMSYEQSGQWKKAEAELKAALEIQPDHPYVLNYLGYSWADRGENLEQALEMIEKAVSLRPDDGYITDSLGWVLYRLGHYHDAVPSLEQAVALMPYDPVINDHLGDAYWMVGRRLEARFQWRRARNYSEDEKLVETITRKLDSGLEPPAAQISPPARREGTGER